MGILSEILEKRATDKTYQSGGLPHTFVELLGGFVVPVLNTEPDVKSFRHDYYYNAVDNVLYEKVADWSNIDRDPDREDDQYIYYNNRPVLKCGKRPDPKNYGDIYYYDIALKSVFGKIIMWSKVNNA
jgi:hypothetical protein